MCNRRLYYWPTAPQRHRCISSMPQRYGHAPKRPTLVLSLFSATHRLRVSSEPEWESESGGVFLFLTNVDWPWTPIQ